MHFTSSKLPFQIYWGSFIVCKKAKKNVVKTILKSHLIKILSHCFVCRCQKLLKYLVKLLEQCIYSVAKFGWMKDGTGGQLTSHEPFFKQTSEQTNNSVATLERICPHYAEQRRKSIIFIMLSAHIRKSIAFFSTITIQL